MELSILVARVLALTYLAAGVATVSGKLNFSQMIEDFDRSPALTFMTGFITLILGMLLVSYHNFWVTDWRTLVTLAGWAALIKGVLFIACPQVFTKFRSWYHHPRPWGIFMLALGLIFAYFGFTH